MKFLIPFLLLYSFLISSIHASPRTALVIGNSDYTLMPLTNPENDAEDIAAKLESLGFEVIFEKNTNRSKIKSLIREFGQRLKQNGGVGLFFYAGHGLQIDGKNYLVPVDFNATAAYEVADMAVDANLITGAMEEAGNPMNIVLLDACRDNPFPRKSRSTSRGLARMDSASGTIIAYSTGPGDVAADGEGRNSPYTSNLLKYMDSPGLTIEQVFKKVRVGVEDSTEGKQLPWETSSLRGDFYFKSMPEVTAPTRLTAQPSIEIKSKSSDSVLISTATSHIKTPEIALTQIIDVIDINSKKLSIFTNPENSTVRLLNSNTAYSMGVTLKPGDYRVEVSSEGYSSKKQWVTIDKEDLAMQITLVPKL